MTESSTRFDFKSPRAFAVDVVRRLREAGFDALWAGGCVRDQLLGEEPKDFDVATSATPEDVIRLFGRRPTIPVGASFGVIIVLGPTKAAGQVEVATFRSDGLYLDGRRPSSVAWCRPEEDARRRDFTINGMFYDPLAGEVIDYVGGQADLTARIIRAIGDPEARFTEDKLRLLRAVRFAATFQFAMEPATFLAVQRLHDRITEVSPERIAQEVRRMLAHSTRSVAVELLLSTGLFTQVFGRSDGNNPGRASGLLATLSKLNEPRFEPAFAAIMLWLQGPMDVAHAAVASAAARRMCAQLRLSNDETGCVTWILEQLPVVRGIRTRALHVLKPLLADPRASLLRDLSRAIALATEEEPVDDDFCRQYLATTPAERLNPAPFIDGRDILGLGVPAGPQIRSLLQQLRNEQLDEILTGREQAMTRLKRLVEETPSSGDR
jgi:poly(A) polymerase